MSDNVDILSRVSLFSKLDKKALKKLSELCVPRSYPKDTVILKEGTHGLGMFLITAGAAEIYKGEGENQISLATLRDGDIIGEMALVDDQPRSASARAIEPTECLLLTRDTFNMLMKKDPEIAWSIVPTLAERLRDSQDRISELLGRLQQRDGGDVNATPTPAGTKSMEKDLPSETRQENKKQEEPVSNQVSNESEELDEGDGTSNGSNPVVTLFRAQYAFMKAGIEGMKGWAALGDTFWNALAKESKLSESNNVTEVISKLPKGSLEAVRSTFEEGFKIPRKMIDSFRDNVKRKKEVDEEE